MLKDLRKARDLIGGFLDWASLYPLVYTAQGREQIVRYLFAMANRHPAIAKEFEKLAAHIAAERMIVNAFGAHANGNGEARETFSDDAHDLSSEEPPNMWSAEVLGMSRFFQKHD